MGAILNTAAAMGAYVVSDRATWLTFDNRQDLAILFEGDEALLNTLDGEPLFSPSAE
ncbi:hypothetical protein IEI94_04105 [Halomonas sp. ML-15]|uniref:hypothetical protein n=1 Tax=Halomonas sp. ML-15 TaxID=2773305 RepID=UPI001746ADF0|nr:hypothetical protein [Halomonas sp. ML-15]MBD3895036.1 hypothetical protein [Halomonas sp. ML-15]